MGGTAGEEMSLLLLCTGRSCCGLEAGVLIAWAPFRPSKVDQRRVLRKHHDLLAIIAFGKFDVADAPSWAFEPPRIHSHRSSESYPHAPQLPEGTRVLLV